jgi:hypothetical protein
LENLKIFESLRDKVRAFFSLFFEMYQHARGRGLSNWSKRKRRELWRRKKSPFEMRAEVGSS